MTSKETRLAAQEPEKPLLTRPIVAAQSLTTFEVGPGARRRVRPNTSAAALQPSIHRRSRRHRHRASATVSRVPLCSPIPGLASCRFRWDMYGAIGVGVVAGWRQELLLFFLRWQWLERTMSPRRRGSACNSGGRCCSRSRELCRRGLYLPLRVPPSDAGTGGGDGSACRR